MKFIFPQNYTFKNKIFGLIDYSTAFVNLLWYAFVFLVVRLFFKNITFQIFIFISLCFPLFLLSLTGLNGENLLFVLSYFIHFLLKTKLFLYQK